MILTDYNPLNNIGICVHTDIRDEGIKHKLEEKGKLFLRVECQPINADE